MTVFDEIDFSSLLSGKSVLITGATGGFGRLFSRRFLEAGADLILLGRSSQKLDVLAEELSALRSCSIRHLTADIRDQENIRKAVAHVLELWGLPDILLNNAAMQGPIGPTWENDRHLWEDTMRINLMAPVTFCREMIPPMLLRGSGKIINISGGGAAGPRPNFTAYACSKAALVSFSESLSQELSDTGITVNCIAPGPIRSAMTDEVISAGRDKAGEEEYARALRTTEASAETVGGRAADLAVFLSSHLCDGITGRLISAVWDPWEELPEHKKELESSDIYTLRRIIPADRGKDWGSV